MGIILAALKQGNLQDVKDLIQAGENLDVRDESGITALYYSVEKGYIDIVKLLLMAGANPNMENCFSQEENVTFCINADDQSVHDERSLVEEIVTEIKNLKSTSAIHAAVKTNDIESLRLLLEYGADPNVLDLGGCSPLHWAAAKENLEAVKLLLEARVDTNLQDLANSTALHEAVRRKNVKIIELLITNGANPNIEDITGSTSFDLIENDQQLLDIMLLKSKSIPAGCLIH